jgi:predicted PurR-regulated permease PerM
MGLDLKKQLQYCSIGLAVLLVTIWILGSVLLPFLAGLAIAYFLDPTADKLEAVGMSRVWATVTIMLFAILVIVLFLVLLIPQLVQQTASLVSVAPDYFQQLQTYLTERFPALLDQQSGIRQSLESFVAGMRDKSGELANALVASAFSVVDALIFMVVAPVVAFYMLMDWDRMVKTIDGWVPRDHVATVRQLARDIDKVLAGFVRGQLSVCLILGAFYSIALMIVGLQFGLVVGLVAGLLTFIPYVGSTIGGVLSIGLALYQFWGSPEMILIVAAIFVIGQTVEGNFLTPNLVGSSVQLHPVWLMFALTAFGSLFGFTGMLVAVPVAACIGVFSRFALQKYLSGRLYLGHSGKKVKAQKDTSDG